MTNLLDGEEDKSLGEIERAEKREGLLRVVVAVLSIVGVILLIGLSVGDVFVAEDHMNPKISEPNH